jgi:hypothetical protein
MKILKPLWITCGFISIGLGITGIPLPVLPTTPFLLLSAFCFAKGSDRLDKWFKNTGIYKKHLENFVTSRAMTLKTKLCCLIPASIMLIFAFIGMSHNDCLGTRIGRAFVIIALIFKYVYFFTKIRTISNSDAKSLKNNCAEKKQRAANE